METPAIIYLGSEPASECILFLEFPFTPLSHPYTHSYVLVFLVLFWVPAAHTCTEVLSDLDRLRIVKSKSNVRGKGKGSGRIEGPWRQTTPSAQSPLRPRFHLHIYIHSRIIKA